MTELTIRPEEIRDALDAFERATKGENPRADLIARAQRAE